MPQHPDHRHVSPTLAVVVAGALLLLPLASAHADGPGYGGSADQLSVQWSTDATASAAGTTFAAPGPALVVSGLGFRSRSAVVVQVGDHGRASSRSDPVGGLRILVPATDDADAPGTSVLATGRAPSGTTRVLVGSIPPRPAGVGPMDLVPWLVGGALTCWAAGLAWRRRWDSGRVEAVADAPHGADVALL